MKAWHAEAVRLREQGLRYREIAERLGRPVSSIGPTLRRSTEEGRVADRRFAREWKNRNREANRARDREYQKRDATGMCSCGCCIYDGKSVCGKCHLQQTTHVRRLEVVRLWADGWSRKQIGERYGWSVNHTAAEFGAMRNLGYDLPSRYPMRDGKRVAA